MKDFRNLDYRQSSEAVLRDVKAYLAAGVDPSANDNDAIKFASENGHIEIVKLLLEDSRVDPSAKNNFAIRIAAYYGHIDVVKLLLKDSRVEPSSAKNYAIGYASQNGHIDVIKLLLNHSASDGTLRINPSANDNYAIKFASENGHIEIVKLLLEDRRVDPSANDNYAIRTARDNDHNDIVDILKCVPSVIIKSFYLKHDFHKDVDIRKIIDDKLLVINNLSEKEKYEDGKVIKSLINVISEIDNTRNYREIINKE